MLNELYRAAQGEGVAAEMAREELEKSPPLTDYEMIFWRTFGDLSSERGVGMSPGRIPYLKIAEYANHNDLSRLQTDILIRVTQAMDMAWLNAVAKKQAKPNK